MPEIVLKAFFEPASVAVSWITKSAACRCLIMTGSWWGSSPSLTSSAWWFRNGARRKASKTPSKRHAKL